MWLVDGMRRETKTIGRITRVSGFTDHPFSDATLLHIE
jgi:hypothetical protein